MKTTKHLSLSAIALASGVALSGAAHADDALAQFYGIVDIALGYQTNGLPANGNNGASIVSTVYSAANNPNVGPHTSLWNGGISQNRVGVKGDKAIDADWHAGYLLETGVNVLTGRLINSAQGLVDNSGASNASAYQTVSTNGSQNGQLLNREAYLNFGHTHWGDLRVGRNNTLIHDVSREFDPTAASPIFGFLTASSGFGGGSGISETTRLNNSVKYLNSVGPFNVGLFHAWGDGTALATQGHTSGVEAGYAADKWHLQYAYTSQTDAIKESVSSTAGDIGATAYNSKGWILGASYLVDDQWTIKAGVSHYDLSAPSDNLSSITSINGFNIASPGITAYKGTDLVAQLDWVGVNYKASDKVTVYSGYYRANYDSYTSTVSSAFNATPGHINWTSLLVDYQWDESKDTYLALADIGLSNTSTTSAIAGTTKSSSAYAPISNNALVSVGVRVKF